jgi:hypothetical protein
MSVVRFVDGADYEDMSEEQRCGLSYCSGSSFQPIHSNDLPLLTNVPVERLKRSQYWPIMHDVSTKGQLTTTHLLIVISGSQVYSSKFMYIFGRKAAMRISSSGAVRVQLFSNS